MANMLFRVLMILSSTILLRPNATAAHEYWVEPTAHIAALGDTVAANLNVGQDYSGTTYPYLPSRQERFWVTNREGSADVKGVTGDVPAATLRDLPEGLHIISYASTADELTFKDWETFKFYVAYEGNDWAIEAHRSAGLPLTGFTEAYRRYAKALVQVGPPLADQDVDQKVGMPFELVALASPYLLEPNQAALPVLLLWQGAPMANQQINIFRRADPTVLTSVTTDIDGRALIPVTEDGRYLLNAVRMERAPSEAEQTWDSYWASLTFEIRASR